MSFTLKYGLIIAACWIAGMAAAGAHQTGTSRFRLNIGDEAIEARFQIDLLTWLRIAPGLDRNHDDRISRDEAAAGLPDLSAFFSEHVSLDIDGAEADGWGKALPFVWPNADGQPIGRAEYHRLLVQFPFRKKVPRRPSDVRVTFDVFVEFGVNHRVLGEIGCDVGKRESIEFTHLEPDYLYDVEYARRHLAKSTEP